MTCALTWEVVSDRGLLGELVLFSGKWLMEDGVFCPLGGVKIVAL